MDATASKIRTTQALVIVGGAATAVGSLLPWATASSAFGGVSFAGTDGDGMFTLILGAAIAVAAWLRIDQRAWQIAILVGCGLAGFVAVYTLTNVSRAIGEESSSIVHMSIGSGLYVTLIGIATAAVALIMHMRAE